MRSNEGREESRNKDAKVQVNALKGEKREVEGEGEEAEIVGRGGRGKIVTVERHVLLRDNDTDDSFLAVAGGELVAKLRATSLTKERLDDDLRGKGENSKCERNRERPYGNYLVVLASGEHDLVDNRRIVLRLELLLSSRVHWTHYI